MKSAARKVVTAIVAAGAFYLLVPAVVHPDLLYKPQLWILVVVALLISIFQPLYKPIDRTAPQRDRGTASQIVWSVYCSQLLGIIEAVLFRYPESFVWDVTTTIACVGMAFGLCLRIWAVLTLGRYFTWFISVLDDHQVIRTGPFRFMRHPAYGGAWILFTCSLLFLHAWVSAAVSFFVQFLAYQRRIRYEEELLVEKLSTSYVLYARDVKALVPFLW